MAQSIKKKYDHIIIGTGQAVGVLLKELISTGEKIAVVEGNKVGGSCVNYGCTPTKTLVASAEAIHKCRQGDEYGFSLGQLNVDYGRIRERMNDLRNESNNGLTEWMETTENVDLIRGYAKFTDKKCIEVEGEIFEGERIYINAGTHPFLPPIDGIEEVPWMDSEKLLEIEHLPRYLIIVGGGYVGVEFAQIYRRFGCDVTLIQSGDQLLKGEDEDIADSIKEILEDEAIQIHLNARARKVTGSEGSISVEMEAKGMTETVEGSHLLIATGRRANSKKLELENAGVNTDGRGNIEVDDYCRTNKAGVFALGDINGKGGFTHTAVHDAQVLVDHLYGQGERKISDRNTIYGVFTDPPLGRVGLSEEEALNKGFRVLKATKKMAEISRAKEMSETKGFVKILVDAETDMILGVSILGSGGDEIVNMFATIMQNKIPYQSVQKVVLIHPTISELMPFVLNDLEEVK